METKKQLKSKLIIAENALRDILEALTDTDAFVKQYTNNKDCLKNSENYVICCLRLSINHILKKIENQ